MTSDQKLNPHEEIKSTNAGNYLNIKESLNILFSFLLLIDAKYVKLFITSIM